jgi:hypothetical protein
MSYRFPRLKNHKFPIVLGSSIAINDDAWSLLWDSGDAVPTLPTSVDDLSIVSSDAGDDTSDVVVVDYLDSNWNERRALFIPNGTTPVTQGTPIGSTLQTISAIAVQRARYYGDAANAGLVQVKIGSTVLCAIQVGRRESQTPLYTVPAGQKAVIHGIGYSCSEAVHFRLRKYVNGETGWITEHEWFAANAGYLPFNSYPRRVEVQGDDGATRQETKITLALEAYAPDAGTDTDTEASAWLDLEVSRSDTSAPGFLYG